MSGVKGLAARFEQNSSSASNDPPPKRNLTGGWKRPSQDETPAPSKPETTESVGKVFSKPVVQGGSSIQSRAAGLKLPGLGGGMAPVSCPKPAAKPAPTPATQSAKSNSPRATSPRSPRRVSQMTQGASNATTGSGRVSPQLRAQAECEKRTSPNRSPRRQSSISPKRGSVSPRDLKEAGQGSPKSDSPGSSKPAGPGKLKLPSQFSAPDENKSSPKPAFGGASRGRGGVKAVFAGRGNLNINFGPPPPGFGMPGGPRLGGGAPSGPGDQDEDSPPAGRQRRHSLSHPTQERPKARRTQKGRPVSMRVPRSTRLEKYNSTDNIGTLAE